MKKKQPKSRSKSKAFVDAEMHAHYKELFETSISELKFEKLNVAYLLSILEEIESFTNDAIVELVIDNARQRHDLDKVIHARNIFSTDNK